MSDIVERLRKTVEAFDNGYPPPAMMTADEAAELLAEIERCYGAIADLQAEVRRKSEEMESLRCDMDLLRTSIKWERSMIGALDVARSDP